MTESRQKHRSSLLTRALAGVALAAVGVAIICAGRVLYRSLTDSYVAPITLSPQSDVVITSNLRLSQLSAERVRLSAEMTRLDDEITVNTEAIKHLQPLRRLVSGALKWTDDLNREQLRAGSEELSKLQQRRKSLEQMQAQQSEFVVETQSNLEAGLTSKMEYLRELNAQSQLRLALMDTDRLLASASLQVTRTRMAQEAIRSTPEHGGATAMPQMLQLQKHQIEIELRINKLEMDRKAAATKRDTIRTEIERINELVTQMKARPLYRAVEGQLNVVFVPYSQLDGVVPDAFVYECLWGIFSCEHVGVVAEVLPGEVSMPDHWGSLARGQYAVLNLVEIDAAKATTLRVRPVRSHKATARATTPVKATTTRIRVSSPEA